MNYIYALLAFFIGCAHSPMDKKRQRIIDCVKDLRQNEFKADEAERICTNVFYHD